MLAQYQDNASRSCWDAQRLAAGAQLALRPCTSIAQTQVFTSMKFGAFTVLSIGDGLCVAMDGKKLATLAPCKNGAAEQKLTTQLATFTALKVSTAPIRVDTTITTMTIGNKCIDGSNPSKVVGAVCNNGAAQQWYFFWGQIRNVQNGLCLDAPRAQADDGKVQSISLSDCSGYPTINSQLWMTSGNVLRNLVSYNCIRLDSSNNIVLGTGACGASDSLKAQPNNINGMKSFVVDLGNAPCTTPKLRKDFRDLTAAEQQTFFSAMNTLRKTPSLMGRANFYHDFVALHGMGAGWFHGSPLFLPWHRYFLALLEATLAKAANDPTLALPYWGWGTDNTDWYKPAVGMFTDDRFGTSGEGHPNHCVTDGFMKGQWTPTDNKCLVRDFTSNTGGAVTLYSEAYMLAAFTVNPNGGGKYTDYDTFRQIVEGGPHNNFHMAVAGNDGNSEMGNPAVSTNDPIFFMHHNNIDRYWHYFQRANPKLAMAYDGTMSFPPDSSSRATAVKQSDLLTGFNVPVSAGMGAAGNGAMCYNYQAYSKSAASVRVAESKLGRRSRYSTRDEGSVLDNLHPEVAAHVEKIDSVLGAGESNLAGDVAPTRDVFTPLSDAFLARMAPFMNRRMNVTAIREMEAKSQVFLDSLHEKIDDALQTHYGVEDPSKATFEQAAVAVKVAIASLAAGL
ncbi:hypothetical protein HK101_007455 [Irineochytrium annulatum]|nr:hypothetical protein HK101_007455 [Irineochytrium annulatum]